MSHDNYRELLSLSLYEEVDDAQKASLQEHLKECEACRIELIELKRLQALAGKKSAEPSEQELQEARYQLRTALRNEQSKIISWKSMPSRKFVSVLKYAMAAAFDELTRTNKDDLMKRQIKDAWPNVFRMSRFIPAVEFVQANRIRYLIIQEMAKMLSQVDVYIAPSLEGDNLLLTNLTGHPCVVVPNGFSEKGLPTSISFHGNLFDEATVLAVAKKYQDATEFHKKHPAGF